MSRTIVAKEVNPRDVDFSYYFEGDSFKDRDNICNNIIIPPQHRRFGFNAELYKDIKDTADCIIEWFEDIKEGGSRYGSYRQCMEDFSVHYTSGKCSRLKKWASRADTDDLYDVLGYLTITTGKKWNCAGFCGYSQGDYCEVIYCEASYKYETVHEFGKLWLGCGAEFIIDGSGGYYVIDSIRWEEGDALRNSLADMHGCRPEDLIIYLVAGEHIVTDYKRMAS